MKTHIYRSILWGLLAVVILALAGCGSQQEGPKVYKVGTDASYAPFGFKDEASGAITGFDVDIIQAIADKEGIQVEVENLNFDGLVPALETNNLDIAISDMTISPERAQKVDFTNPYYIAGNGLVVSKNNSDIHSFADLKGKRVGVSIGSTGAEIVRHVEAGEVRSFNTIVDAFLELHNGGVDAVINDTPVNEYYVSTKGRDFAKITGEDYDPQPLGIAVKKGNTELLNTLNDGLAKIKADGTYNTIYKKWFGKDAPAE